jgi:hypothetical protein
MLKYDPIGTNYPPFPPSTFALHAAPVPTKIRLLWVSKEFALEALDAIRKLEGMMADKATVRKQVLFLEAKRGKK